jgi:polyferredoxin
VNALADVVLVMHAGIVLFVVGGLIAIVVGNLLGWQMVNAWSFRVAHLAAIAVVVAETWLGITCPLTTVEVWLRERAGGDGYQSGFIEHWLQQLLFYDAPAWVFTLAYTLFALLVVAAWWRYPPRRRSPRPDGDDGP